MEGRKRILVVEDEKHIAEGLRLNLVLHGYEVRLAANGLEALRQWREWSPALIVLDLMMPGMDGFGVVEQIRQKDERLPILVLSARDQDRDKVRCLAGGVDDYLTKPFHLDEFLLRVDRLVKRAEWSEESEVLTPMSTELPDLYDFGHNRIDFTHAVAWGCEGEFRPTSQEMALLRLFVSNQGRPLSRREILEEAWGLQGETSTRTVDNFVVRLRRYFEPDPKNPRYFKGLRSVGYIFEVPPEDGK